MFESGLFVIHFFVILLVLAACDVVHPLLVVKVPPDGLLYAFLELQGWLPAQFFVEFARIDRIAEVVASTVGDIGNQVE